MSNITIKPNGPVLADVVANCGAATAKFTLKVGNSNGETATDTLTVRVDEAAPSLVLKNSTTMWPPNGKYGVITISDMVRSVSDLCNERISINDVRIETVSSDEAEDAPGNSDGNTTNDIVIASDCRSVSLRSERDVTKNGRVYSIGLMVRDNAGNITRSVFTVSVPILQLSLPALRENAAFVVNSSCQ